VNSDQTSRSDQNGQSSLTQLKQQERRSGDIIKNHLCQTLELSFGHEDSETTEKRQQTKIIDLLSSWKNTLNIIKREEGICLSEKSLTWTTRRTQKLSEHCRRKFREIS